MIVSHEHKFIFVHLKRTSGRALQNSLDPHLGPEDIATPVGMGSDDGKRGVQGRNCEGLRRHWSARQIRELVGEDVWREYFKFTIERNPWDKTLSRYFGYLYRDDSLLGRTYKRLTREPMPFAHWLRVRKLRGDLLGRKHYHLPLHLDEYSDENGEPIVDVIARYENRDQHLSEIGERIGIRIDPEVRVGSKPRASNRKHYTEMFDRPWMREFMNQVFEKDLEFLGYRFGEPHPTNLIECRSLVGSSA